MCLKPSCHRRTPVHVDSALWARSELTVSDSVIGLTPDHHGRGRKRRGYNSISGRTADGAVRAPKAFLRFSGHREGATPVELDENSTS